MQVNRNTSSVHGPVRRGVRARSHGGFTLVEILIVVVILGILASIVLPQFTNASNQARENTLKDELRYLRTQVAVYKAQHRDVSPGYEDGDSSALPSTDAALVEQLTQYSDERSGTNPTPTATKKFGPYLSVMPKNPLNSLSAVKISSDDPLTPGDVETYGWVYNPKTLEIIANLAGADSNGTPYADY